MNSQNAPSQAQAAPKQAGKLHPALYGSFYLSQGFAAKKKITNDCGPTSLAIMLNILTASANLAGVEFDKEIIKHGSALRFWERIPDFVPLVGGATAPWGLVNAFNNWAAELRLNWRAQRISHASRKDILENLLKGNLLSALKVWPVWGAHWVNVVDFSSQHNLIYVLDPNPYLERLPEERRVLAEEWQLFERDWSRLSWWTWLLGLRNELVVYTQK